MKAFKMVCPECHYPNTVTSEAMECSRCKEDLDHPFSVEVNAIDCKLHIEENEIGVLVDFYSTTCGPCMAMYDDYEDASLGFGATVRFLKINADSYPKIAKEYGVSALPTIIAFKNANELERVSRQLSAVELTLWAQKISATQ